MKDALQELAAHINKDADPKSKRSIRQPQVLSRKQREKRRKDAAAAMLLLHAKKNEHFATHEQLIADGELPPPGHTPKIEATPIPMEEVIDEHIEAEKGKSLRPVFEDEEPVVIDHREPRIIGDEKRIPDEASKLRTFQDKVAAMPKGMRRLVQTAPLMNIAALSQAILPQGKQRTITLEIRRPGSASTPPETKPCCYCRKPRSPKFAFCSAKCRNLYKENGNQPIEYSPERIKQANQERMADPAYQQRNAEAHQELQTEFNRMFPDLLRDDVLQG